MSRAISPAVLGILTLVVGFFPVVRHWIQVRMQRPVAMRIIGQPELASGVRSAYRIQCADPLTGNPLAGAQVEATLLRDGRQIATVTGTSGADGEVLAPFDVPRDLEGSLDLEVSARTGSGLGRDTDRRSRRLKVSRRHKLLLTSDKPFYQPGQTMHLRVLVLTRPSLAPLTGFPVVFEVLDPKDNKVFKEEVAVSEFGVAAAKFRLADLVNEGEYKLRAMVAPSGLPKPSPDLPPAQPEVQERTVTVKPYVLPKFKVELTTDRPYYRPGETVTARVDARYFFGKPAGGTVQVELSAFTAGFTSVASASAPLSDQGSAQVPLPLPAVLAGLESEGGRALMLIKARVTDKAGHSQEVGHTFTVARSAMAVEAIPEAGRLVPGVENIVYVVVARPDGTPLPDATVTVPARGLTARTDAAGVAELKVVPDRPSDTWELVVEGAGGLSERLGVKLRDSATADALQEPVHVHTSQHVRPDGGASIRVVTSRVKDGTPVPCRVRLPELGVSSDRMASDHEMKVPRIPAEFEVEVSDAGGGRQLFRQRSVTTSNQRYGRPGRGRWDRSPGFAMRVDRPSGASAGLLLRTDDGIYQVGDSARLTVLSADSTGTVYLDVVREGQTVSTRTLELAGGRVETTLDLTQDMTGTLRLHAYRILPSGQILRSGKVIAVGATRSLSVVVKPDKQTYLPGEKARVDFAVTDPAGKPVQALLGLDVVDESVFALADFAPGLERVYFAIEQELLNPRYQIRCAPGSFDVGAQVRHRWCGTPRQARDVLSRIARVLLAPIVPEGDLNLLMVSIQERKEALLRLRVEFFSGLMEIVALLWMPLTLVLLMVWVLLRGAGAAGSRELEPGSKQELQYARIAWAAALPTLAAVVLGIPAAVGGGFPAMVVFLLTITLLVGLITIWSGAESRAHLPPGLWFHGGTVLLFAYGAQVSVLLLAAGMLPGEVPASAGVAIPLAVLAPLLALGAYTCQIARPAVQATLPGQRATAGSGSAARSVAFLGVLVGGLIFVPVLYNVFVEALPLDWHTRRSLMTPYLMVLWLLVYPPALGLGMKLTRWLDQSCTNMLRLALLGTTWLAGVMVFKAVGHGLRWDSPTSRLLTELESFLFWAWLLLGPALGFLTGRLLGFDLAWVRRERPQEPAPLERLVGLRGLASDVLPAGMLFLGLTAGVVLLDSVHWELRQLVGWVLGVLFVPWLIGGPLLGGLLAKVSRIRPAAHQSSGGVALGLMVIGVLVVGLPFFLFQSRSTSMTMNGRVSRSFAPGMEAKSLAMRPGAGPAAQGEPAPAPAVAPEPRGATAEEKASVRVRSFFPETLHSNPALLTDDRGRAR
ncbi:MAG: hypothetical protein HY815_26685, partial [Candidatus Riflebacteria bacterium]|nr:hypothetical protein [Candidatus Riflebacteria bacterium]